MHPHWFEFNSNRTPDGWQLINGWHCDPCDVTAVTPDDTADCWCCGQPVTMKARILARERDINGPPRRMAAVTIPSPA